MSWNLRFYKFESAIFLDKTVEFEEKLNYILSNNNLVVKQLALYVIE